MPENTVLIIDEEVFALLEKTQIPTEDMFWTFLENMAKRYQWKSTGNQFGNNTQEFFFEASDENRERMRRALEIELRGSTIEGLVRIEKM